MQLRDVFDLGLYKEMLDEGFIRIQSHPTQDLVIANYTPKAQWSRTWNEVTQQCRGLIWNGVTNEVVARPFSKFFNLGELSDAEVPREPFKVFEKLDGSLGILYRDGSGWGVATRGSFTSDQAKWATAFLRSTMKMPPDLPSPLYWEPREGWTYLFEIIYPANRIVVDYGRTETLVLLDVIDNETGESRLTQALAQRPHAWFGPAAKEYDGFDALETLLEAEQPLNSEGYVIRFESGMRAKVKHDEYVRLHRIVTGVSTKTVWEYLKDNKPFVELLDRVPDEFFQWLTDVRTGLERAFREIEAACEIAFDEELSLTGMNMTEDDGGIGVTPQFRKAFALRIQDHPNKDILFRMLDMKSCDEAIWKRLRPAFEKPFMTVSEDTA